MSSEEEGAYGAFNELKAAMIVHMGNDAGIYHMYKYVCLIVDVGSAGKRNEIETGQREDERRSYWDENEPEGSEDEGSEDED